MVDDLLIRVDAQVSEFNASMGSATKSTLQLEAALKSAQATQERYQAQLAAYGAKSAEAQRALATAQRSNAALAEKSAALQAQAAAKQKAAMEAQAAAMSRVGRTFVAAGAGITLALGLSAKAASDWEHSWALARQAISGTPKQLQEVEDGLRGLATTLPVTHDQILEIARSAGQLGVQTPHIVEFTKVVAELGQTSDLAGDEAATSLARILNVMGAGQGQVDNLASALTKLGQSGASTVGEISALTLRLAAAGRTAGLSVGDVTGLANAMSSLGIQAESGGTNFSKTILSINTAVTSGGKELKGFAAIAGQSADQFKKDWGQDATATIVDFLKGLDQIRKSGGDVAGTLGDLHITSQRQIDVLSRLSQNTDMVTASLQDGNKAYKDNTALGQAFAKVQETTASKVQVAENNLRDLAITIGDALLPAIGDAASKGADFLGFLGDMPPAAGKTVEALTAVTVAMTLLGGGSLYAQGKLTSLAASMVTLEEASGRTVISMTGFRLGAAALAGGLLYLDSQTNESAGAFDTLQTAAEGALVGFAVGGPWGAAIGAGAGALYGLGKAFGIVGGSADDATKDVIDFSGALDVMTRRSSEATKQLVAQKLQQAGLFDIGKQLHVTGRTLVDAIVGTPADLNAAEQRLDSTLNAIGNRLDAAIARRDAFATSISPEALGGPPTAQQAARLEALKAHVNDLSDAYDETKDKVNQVKAALESNRTALDQQMKATREQANATRDHNIQVAKLRDYLNELPKEVKMAFTQPGFDDSYRNLVALGKQADLTPKEIRMLLRLDGYDVARSQLSGIQSALASVDGYIASASVVISTIAHGTSSASGHAEGGYTGPGAKYEPAGVVHRGEFVMDKESTSRIGVGNLYSMMRAARGYDSGGMVGTAAGSGQFVQRQANINIGKVEVADRGETERWLRRSAQRAADMAAS